MWLTLYTQLHKLIPEQNDTYKALKKMFLIKRNSEIDVGGRPFLGVGIEFWPYLSY